MAFHHIAFFFTLALLWHILVSAQSSLEYRGGFLPAKSSHLFLRQPSPRAMKKISHRAFQDMELYTARGYGKRSSNCFGGKFCGKRMPEFSGARLYGKRNVEMNSPIKCLFVNCLELERNMRNMDLPRNKFRKSDEVVLPD